MHEKMTIGKVTKATGLSPKAIRYYEEMGLLSPRPRTEGGYRQYEDGDIKRLLFIRRAKELGIPIRRISELLNCRPAGTCAETRPALKNAIREQMEELDARIRFLSELRSRLENELAEIDRRPLSDHGQGACDCLGGTSRLLSVQAGRQENQGWPRMGTDRRNPATRRR
jgi:DNA-binding transcriptional MerR regulator